MLRFLTAYGSVQFELEFAWTTALKELKQNGSLNDFLHRQLDFEVRGGN